MTTCKTGAEHIKSLKDGRTVYIDGKLVADVTEHPAFRNSVRSAASLYDFQARPERDVDGRPAVLLCITPLSATTFDLGQRDSGHSALVQHVLDLLELFVANDRNNHLHTDATSCVAGACSP